MRIVHIIYCMKIGGAQTMLTDIINEQCKTDEVHLIIINDYDVELLSEISPQVFVHKINRPKGSKNPFHFFKLNLLLLAINSDVIHSHDASIIRILFVKKNTPKFLTVHDTGLKIDYYNLYNRIISISDAVYIDIKKRANIDSIIIKNGIVVDNIHFLKHPLNKVRNVFKIVQVSRLSIPKKGQDILIKAVSLLVQKGYHIQLDFIGIGESEQYLKQLVRSENIESNVNFLGLKYRKYIYENLCQYDLFVQPSRNEGFGLTVAEAVASGIPVLVSNIEGPLEIIDKGNYGYFFQSNNIVDCANAIEKIILNTNPLDSIKNREYVKEKFNIEFTVRDYKSAYNLCLHNIK